MKQLFRLVFAAVAVLMVAQVHAQQVRYISDDLFTYMHRGPSTQYRILGSVDAGTKVTVLETNRESGFTKVLDDRGRTGWVNSDFISNQVGLKERLPKLEKELSEVKKALANAKQSSDERNATLQSSLESRTEQITDLENRNSSLNEQLSTTQAEIRELRAKLDTQADDLLMKWFTYGGMVAGGGLLFGLVLPHLIPRRKKRNNGWA
ncbi:SH3 domain-containing protein [Photobacterium sp. GJ3]|nr:SH3 domain-containing protein [Photobacterium sp. GJ3]